MPVATDEIRTCIAKHAALTRDRAANDPELIAARNGLFLAQRRAGYHAGIDTTEAIVSGEPYETAVGHLRVRGVPIQMQLLGAIEMLAYVVSLADCPGELIAALRERADAAHYSTAAGTNPAD